MSSIATSNPSHRLFSLLLIEEEEEACTILLSEWLEKAVSLGVGHTSELAAKVSRYGLSVNLASEALVGGRVDDLCFMEASQEFLDVLRGTSLATLSPLERRVFIELQRTFTSKLTDCVIHWSDASNLAKSSTDSNSNSNSNSDSSSDSDSGLLVRETEFILACLLAILTVMINYCQSSDNTELAGAGWGCEGFADLPPLPWGHEVLSSLSIGIHTRNPPHSHSP